MEYNFKTIEQDWQKYWADNKTFKAEEKSNKPKYYVLDMFPYPSGAGLHVGHPLGYIASDIYARYKRLKGFNVLHPMGYDSFGLPAEQYAIQTGQHPAITTQQNIARYREQLDKIGFSFDWDREVRTSNPDYYKWTQWIFIQLFNSWYNPETDKAEKIETLIDKFKQKVLPFGEDLGGADWDKLSEKEQQDILMNYRLTYLSEAWVNWCPALGTVLANDEVKDGVSERGGHPVERKLMKQWSMRITAYAQRLLDGLETIDWTESIKEAQRNWIGRSVGTSLKFKVAPSNSPEGGELPSANPSLLGRTGGASIEVFTTRPDTIFGVSFVTLAPEHELVNELTTTEYKQAVDEYVLYAKNRSERERQADVKKITGQFTGSYVLHPFTNEPIPVWIGDYVLAGYGTGAVMAVPAHDTRDYAFAKYFNLPIKEVVAGGDLEKEAYDAKEGKLVNSDFLNGLEVKEAIKKAIAVIEEKSLGKGKTNYRLRDAVFGRQRYWGEPIPVYFENGIAKVLPEDKLPLVLPEVDKYLPTEDGEPPLARAKDWSYEPISNSPQKGEDGGSAKWQTAANSSWGELKERSRDLRNNQTEAELALWNHLNTKQLDYKFRRQHVIGTNIVDFVCLSKKLIIEVDGKIHLQQKEYDQARTNELESLGFKVIRFENEHILSNIDDVLNEITTELKVLPFGEDLGGAPYETTTMPGWAGSSWYFYRYMDNQNNNEFASQQSINYWQDVDLYIGGSEHATGHLLYSRFWNKFLFDLGLVPKEEPFKKLINQGMIQGRSNFVYRVVFIAFVKSSSSEEKELKNFPYLFVTKAVYDDFISTDTEKKENSIRKIEQAMIEINEKIKVNQPNAVGDIKFQNQLTPLNVDVNIVNNDILDVDAFRNWRLEYANAEFILEEDGKYICGVEVEKMSKSKYNVVSPDDICEKFGADTLRLYEMFLGPLELSKPWNTNGITGVHGFLKKLWRLFYASGEFVVSNDEPTKTELKTLHKTIKKIVEDIERFSFNTSVSNFMICVNELTDAKCNKRAILEPLLITLAPYAPHIAEELWKQLGNKESITFATFPEYNESYLVDDTINYPVSFNGKTRFMLELAATMNAKEIEDHVMALADTQKYLEGKTPKKVIIVPKKIVNIVI